MSAVHRISKIYLNQIKSKLQIVTRYLCQSRFLLRRSSISNGEGNGTPTPVFLPGESQGQGSLVGFRLWGRTESDTTEATQQQQAQYFKTIICLLEICISIELIFICSPFHWKKLGFFFSKSVSKGHTDASYSNSGLHQRRIT